jgi:hypothetical protein
MTTTTARAALSLLCALLVSACAQGLTGISATGYYPPQQEAERNASDPVIGPPSGGLEVFQ